MTQQNEAIRLAVDKLGEAEKRHQKIRNALDFIRYGTSRKTVDGQALADAGNNLSAARTEVTEAIEALRPLLDQTSDGVGDGGYGIIDAIEWADGVAGALGSEYASRVTDEEIAVAMAIKSALTQADQQADKDDRQFTDKERAIYTDLILECPAYIWERIVAKHYTEAEIEQKIAPIREILSRALSGSDGRE